MPGLLSNAEDYDGLDSGSGSIPPEYTRLRVSCEALGELGIRIPPKTKMQRLMKCFSDRMDVPLKFLKFVFIGRELKEDDTVHMLKMQHDDIIHVFITQY